MKFGFCCIQLPHLERPNLSDYEASTNFHVVFCEKAPGQIRWGAAYLAKDPRDLSWDIICLWWRWPKGCASARWRGLKINNPYVNLSINPHCCWDYSVCERYYQSEFGLNIARIKNLFFAQTLLTIVLYPSCKTASIRIYILVLKRLLQGVYMHWRQNLQATITSRQRPSTSHYDEVPILLVSLVDLLTALHNYSRNE